MFEFASFIMRNPEYMKKDWRMLREVRKVMLRHRDANPLCEWCGRNKNIQVHHIIPVSVKPHRVADPSNLITLCRSHHLYVGHNGNYRTRYTPNIKELSKQHQVTAIR